MFPVKDNIPLARFPIVTVVLVAVSVISYVLETHSGHGGSFLGGPTDAVELRYGVVPHQLTHPDSHTRWGAVLTSMFLYTSFLSILTNMLGLAIFGPAVEDALGRVRFPVLYLLGGLVGLGLQVAAAPSSTASALGSTGAVAAVLGGYIVLYPRARILSLVFIVFFVTIIEVPAVLLLGVWLAARALLGLEGLGSSVAGEGTAYLALIGGFAFGLLSIRPLVKHHAPGLPRAAA
jgi:membrane associated rhomboid family serine protease